MEYKSKAQLKERRNELMKQVAAIDKELDAIGDNTLSLKNRDYPFRRWSITECSRLYDINPIAYEWFGKHREATVAEYNALHFSTNKIVLED